ncbi:hypothetical protein C8R45DRAFT_923111 [Mycena sanguinolenta]|nr:hypothetical protein C8R45DRAFT_923111 [Mycena sanguinolenta]
MYLFTELNTAACLFFWNESSQEFICNRRNLARRVRDSEGRIQPGLKVLQPERAQDLAPRVREAIQHGQQAQCKELDVKPDRRTHALHMMEAPKEEPAGRVWRSHSCRAPDCMNAKCKDWSQTLTNVREFGKPCCMQWREDGDVVDDEGGAETAPSIEEPRQGSEGPAAAVNPVNRLKI